jgi:hypothetical protein
LARSWRALQNGAFPLFQTVDRVPESHGYAVRVAARDLGVARLAGRGRVPQQVGDVVLAWGAIVKFYDALKAAGNNPEAHIFGSGGHGFGVKKQGTSSDHWIDEFYYWLDAQGLTRRAGKSNP